MPTLLITGANRGLGLEFVRQYAANGWTVIATARDKANIGPLCDIKAAHENVCLEILDVADLQSIKTLADRLQGTPIDLLINNAGIYSGNGLNSVTQDPLSGQNFGAIDAEAWDRVFKINTIAPIMVSEAFTSHISQGKERKIINITSKMGSIELMNRGSLAYRTSKAALNAAMRNVSLELKDQNIIIVNLHPGWVQTDMGGKSADLAPETSISAMRKVIAGLTLKDSGTFLNYDGTILPW